MIKLKTKQAIQALQNNVSHPIVELEIDLSDCVEDDLETLFQLIRSNPDLKVLSFKGINDFIQYDSSRAEMFYVYFLPIVASTESLTDISIMPNDKTYKIDPTYNLEGKNIWHLFKDNRILQSLRIGCVAIRHMNAEERKENEALPIESEPVVDSFLSSLDPNSSRSDTLTDLAPSGLDELKTCVNRAVTEYMTKHAPQQETPANSSGCSSNMSAFFSGLGRALSGHGPSGVNDADVLQTALGECQTDMSAYSCIQARLLKKEGGWDPGPKYPSLKYLLFIELNKSFNGGIPLKACEENVSKLLDVITPKLNLSTTQALAKKG